MFRLTEEEIHECLVDLCGWDGQDYEHGYKVYDYFNQTGLQLSRICGDHASIEQINEFAELWESNNIDQDKLVEIANEEVFDIDGLIELAEHLDDYTYIEAENEIALAAYYVEELGAFEDVPEEFMVYFNYAKYGKTLSVYYTRTKNGYYCYN